MPRPSCQNASPAGPRPAASGRSLPALLAVLPVALLVAACGEPETRPTDLFQPTDELCPELRVPGVGGRVVSAGRTSTVRDVEVRLGVEGQPVRRVLNATDPGDAEATFHFAGVPDGRHTLRGCKTSFHGTAEVEVRRGRSDWVCLILDRNGPCD